MLRSLIHKIADFLISETVWIFFSVLLFGTTVLLLENEMNRTWMNYWMILLSLSFWFSPILLFSSFREKLKKRWSSKYQLFWSLCFIVYPVLLLFFTITFDYQLLFMSKGEHAIGSDESYFMMAIAGVLLLVEGLIHFNDFLLKKIPNIQWLKKIELEKVILCILFIISMFGVWATNVWQEEVIPLLLVLPKFFYYAIQYFLIFFAYYLFYWINHYLLINYLFKKKGVIYYIFGFVGVVFLFYPFAAQFMGWLPITSNVLMHPTGFGEIFDPINFGTPVLIMLSSIPFVLGYQWIKQRYEINDLEKEKTITELSLLKQQINPHFFFNTLNNLYALSITKDKQTPEVILQLSELMRYVIYKGKEEKVELHEEVKYIEDYIELQKIRLHKDLDFTFDKFLPISHLKIPPLLFIVFVENAFKHGIEPAEKASFLNLNLSCEEKKIIFTCKNSIEGKNNKPKGIGLENLKRRLELLYPEKHYLKIEEGEDYFNTRLEISMD